MQTGRRAWQCELSTVDSTFLMAGALTAGIYFNANTADESEIRTLGDALYRRADWQWAQNQGATVTHGWKPESGFLNYRWEGYDEAMLLYVLGLGSPTYPLPENSYTAWTSSYRWEHCFGYDYLYAGPLFTHQLSHIWLDFRKIQDTFMGLKGIDYFENSRRATYVQQRYAIENPLKFSDYCECCWGLRRARGLVPALSSWKELSERSTIIWRVVYHMDLMMVRSHPGQLLHPYLSRQKSYCPRSTTVFTKRS
jgi:hypothetical protein